MIAGVDCQSALGGDHPTVVWIVDNITQPVGQLFLRLLLMIVVPLVFSSLVVGVAGIGDIRKLGRVGLKSFGYCLVISAISVVIGITLANTIRPGKRIDPRHRCAAAALRQPTLRRLSRPLRRRSSDAEAADVSGGNDRSEEPVFRDLRAKKIRTCCTSCFSP